MLKLGPIGKGTVIEVKTNKGVRFIARWNAFVIVNGVRKRVLGGTHQLGPKVAQHVPGLKSIKQAKDLWDGVRPTIFVKQQPVVGFVSNHDEATVPFGKTGIFKGSAQMKVRDFITLVYEPRREKGLQPNSLANWEYYRNTFINPYFGDYTITEMNDEELIRSFMEHVADGGYMLPTATKVYTYVKAILSTANVLGLIMGNASRLAPVAMRIPKRIKQATSQPALTLDEFVALHEVLPTQRDKNIAGLLFYCGLRRSEWSAVKNKDIVLVSGTYRLMLDRAFDSRSHRVIEWNGVQGVNEGNAKQVLVIPTHLAGDLLAMNCKPDEYLFATRNGKPLIPTNWSEDVLKPAGQKISLPGISFHWFRRGHATDQHHDGVADKAIQKQMRHSKAETTRNVYMQQSDPQTVSAVSNLERRVLAKIAERKERANGAV